MSTSPAPAQPKPRAYQPSSMDKPALSIKVNLFNERVRRLGDIPRGLQIFDGTATRPLQDHERQMLVIITGEVTRRELGLRRAMLDMVQSAVTRKPRQSGAEVKVRTHKELAGLVAAVGTAAPQRAGWKGQLIDPSPRGACVAGTRNRSASSKKK